MGCSKSHTNRKVYGNISPPQETRKSSNKQPNFTSKAARERRIDKTKVSRRKESIKNRAQVNEIATKKTIEKIKGMKSLFFEKINKSDKPIARFIKKKRGLKSIKLEMKMEK